MPLRVSSKASFLKAFGVLPVQEQFLAAKAIEAILAHLKSGQAPYGLRIKKLYETGRQKAFGARVSAHIRIAWVRTTDEIVFTLLGNHDEIQKFLKNL